MTKALFTIQSAQASTKREETGDTVSKWAEEWCSSGQCKKKKVWTIQPTSLPVRAWCLTAPGPGPCSWPSSRHGTPAGPLWSAARSLPAPDRRRPRIAWRGMRQGFFSATSERHAEDRVWKSNMAGHIFCRPQPKCRNTPRKWADRWKRGQVGVLHMQTLPSLGTWTPLWAVWPCCQDISWHCCRPGRLWRRREGRHWPGKQRGWKIRNDAGGAKWFTAFFF